MRNFLFFVFFLFFSANSLANKDLVGIFYRTNDKESLADILKNFNIPDSVSYGKSDFYKKVTNWNPHIQNFAAISPGEKVLIVMPKNFYDRNPPVNFDVVEVSQKEKIKIPNPTVLIIGLQKKKTAKVDRVNNQDESHHLTLFYMASIGSFSETLNSVDMIVSSNQNSPISLGAFWSNQFSDTDHRLESSLYLSKLSATSSGSESIDPPLEFGFNFYNQFPILKKRINFYWGGDFEKFSTINTEEIANGGVAKTYGQNIFYGTVGFSKAFNFSKPLMLRFSLSQSLFSSSESVSSTNESTYSGQRLTLFLSYQLYQQFSVNLLYKKHILSGPTELSIDRFGLGFSYQLF